MGVAGKSGFWGRNSHRDVTKCPQRFVTNVIWVKVKHRHKSMSYFFFSYRTTCFLNFFEQNQYVPDSFTLPESNCNLNKTEIYAYSKQILSFSIH